VLVMSPIYVPEITAQLKLMGVHPDCLVTVEASDRLEDYLRSIEGDQ
jgi:hypothetical protein